MESNVPRLLPGHSAAVNEWVAGRIGVPVTQFGQGESVGVVRGGQCVAGIVLSNFRKMEHGNAVELSVAANDVRWCSRSIIRGVFGYLFEHLQCVRVDAVVARNNRRARRFVERLGFKMEGVGRRAYDGKQDAVHYSMLPHECRW